MGSGEFQRARLRKCLGGHPLNQVAQKRLVAAVQKLQKLDTRYWSDRQIAEHVPMPWPTLWSYLRGIKPIPEWVTLRIEQLFDEFSERPSRTGTE